MKTQHTPAPWKITPMSPTEKGEPQIQITDGYEPIANVPTGMSDRGANARLIAAAPELLAALQDMLDITRFQYKEMATYKYAQEIIKKAKGE